jgi:hypothetical protein
MVIMEYFKQIVFRNEDEALVIIPMLQDSLTKVFFLNQLETAEQNKLIALKELCESKIEEPLKYVVAERGTNILNVEYYGGVLQLNILDLTDPEKLIVQDSIQVCIELIN